MSRIVVVGAADPVCQTVRTSMQALGFGVYAVEHTADLEVALAQHPADVVVIDADVADGYSAAARLRAAYDIGLVMLKDAITREDRLLSLSVGADHLLCKPVDPREFGITVRSLYLRRRGPRSAMNTGAETRSWRLDPVRWTLGTPDGHVVQLSMAEQLVIGRLLDAPGRVASRDELVDLLARHGVRVYSRNLDTLMSRVRRKTRDTGSRDRLPILSARNVGYVFTGACQIADRPMPPRENSGNMRVA